MKYINLVGVELEGGWKIAPPSKVHSDISVHVEDQVGDVPYQAAGEVSSEPMNLEKLSEWVYKNYPDYMNSSCGLHVHVSLKSNTDYIKLMSRDFQSYFLKKMEEWGKKTGLSDRHLFWARLLGYNNFCRKQHRPDEQILLAQKQDRDERYTQINYCYKMHKTIECRLFPMFKYSRVAMSAILAFIDCVESYLDEHREVEEFKPITIEIDKPHGDKLLCVYS